MDIKFIEWLHELTELGYEQDIMVKAKDASVVNEYYKNGLSPKDALDAYKQALNNPTP